MLEEAIDYVKYLQNQVKVHIIYPAHINNHITLATMELAKLNHTVYDFKKQKFPCNSFLATSWSWAFILGASEIGIMQAVMSQLYMGKKRNPMHRNFETI